MHPTRLNLSLLLLVLALTPGCWKGAPAPARARASVVMPAEISIRGYLGFSRRIALNLTYGGEPVQAAGLHLIRDPNQPIPIALSAPGPLNAPPTLIYAPLNAGTSDFPLTFSYGVEQFSILVHSTVTAPSCPPDECAEYKFDAQSEQCIGTPLHENGVCGKYKLSCEAVGRCQQGQCVRVPASNPVPDCSSASSITTVNPAWTYHVPAYHNLQSPPCSLDESGNLYCVDVAKSGCELFSLTRDGAARWQTAVDCPPSSAVPDLQLMGTALLYRSVKNGAQRVEVRRQSDGASLWGLQRFVPDFIVPVGSDRIAQVAPHGQNSYEVQFHDLESGQLLAQVPLQPDESIQSGTKMTVHSMVSDAEGNPIVSWAQCAGYACTPLDWILLLDAEGNVLTRRGVISQVNSPPMLGTAGNQVIFANGRRFTTESMKELPQLPWFYQGQSVTSEVTISPDGSIFAVGMVTSFLAPCSGWLFWRFDRPDGAQTPLCRPIEQTANQASLLLNADGGVAALQPATNASSTLLMYDASGQAQAQIAFADGDPLRVPFQRPLAHGNRLFLYVQSANDSLTYLAAYDIPGFELAPHGWVSAGGNPSRTMRPR